MFSYVLGGPRKLYCKYVKNPEIFKAGLKTGEKIIYPAFNPIWARFTRHIFSTYLGKM